MQHLAVLLASLLGSVGLATLVGGSSADVLGVPAPLAVVAYTFGLNALAFLPAAALRTERFYDAIGALSHLGAAALAVVAADASPRALALALPVCVWAARLGVFLGLRGLRDGDARFDAIKTEPLRFAVAWALQAAWASVTTVAVVASASAVDAPDGLGAIEAVGLTIWALGFALEWSADAYKTRFRARFPGRFVHGGPWDLSRHPNYLGEIVLWCGLFLSATPGLRGGAWAAVASPLFVYVLLRYGSGVPLLEARADARWGGQADYEAYKRRVPVLWPRWPG
jgi:steroid 5-alpha reductase family enzyme